MSELKIRVIPRSLNLDFGMRKDVKLAYDISLGTALRQSEVLDLRIEDLIKQQKFVSVQRIMIKGGRTENVYFNTKLQQKIWDYLREVLRNARHGYLFAPWVCLDVKRKPQIHKRLSPRAIILAWHTIQDRSGVEDQLRAMGEPGQHFRWHDIRHTAITRFYELSKDIYATAKFARHTNINMTKQYIHMNETDLFKMQEGL